jgi:gluconate 2-dehydrogenase gamma chain
VGDLRVLDPEQAAVVAAIAEQIFPADEQGAGATDAHVLEYIDGQLASAWGAGQGLYRAGPFLLPEDYGHGSQSPRTPAEAYAYGLRALGAYTEREFGRRFDALTSDERDAVLTALARGEVDTFEPLLPSSQFFALVRQNVVEGLFADPRHGGNHELIGWRWIDFPGDPDAHGGSYADHIDRPGERYEPEPRALPGPDVRG